MFCSVWNSQAAIYYFISLGIFDTIDVGALTELAPMYLTFPLSTTSFSAFMISSLGVSLSKR